MQNKDYETSFDADGNIRCRFWQAKNVHPWDYILELEHKCKQKFPNAELVKITKSPYIGDDKKCWWKLLWMKDGYKNGDNGWQQQNKDA